MARTSRAMTGLVERLRILSNAISASLLRHGPLYAGHPRLCGTARTEGVDGPDKPGPDGFGVCPVQASNTIPRLPFRHDPLYAGHPRLCGAARKEGVDGPDKPGHDGYFLMVIEAGHAGP